MLPPPPSSWSTARASSASAPPAVRPRPSCRGSSPPASSARRRSAVRSNVARQLNERLTPIYLQVMNAHGANLALDVDATLAHAPAIDVTNEVLTALNAALPSVSVTPMPAPPPGTQPQGR